MTQLVLNNLDPKILDNLKIRAAKHNRSLEDESKAILHEALAAEITTKAEKVAAFREQATQIRQSLHGRTHTDSALLIREDRDQ
jgi:plasmid stability protein